ncbi:hypothetical protein N7474_005677 [Penicillium riverlandense]|uniref:uncharacterized protein n=1 Tax=Penicillium riverlandense TaxID=1903569 RepID=UPI002547506B|nr:uncharacterized protein N7474_005677 [Penicillium riverlandense]KAJ5820086.1 hypothetical protein N7474_005677 [Penicillium riverlandense]
MALPAQQGIARRGLIHDIIDGASNALNGGSDSSGDDSSSSGGGIGNAISGAVSGAISGGWNGLTGDGGSSDDDSSSSDGDTPSSTSTKPASTSTEPTSTPAQPASTPSDPGIPTGTADSGSDSDSGDSGDNSTNKPPGKVCKPRSRPSPDEVGSLTDGGVIFDKSPPSNRVPSPWGPSGHRSTPLFFSRPTASAIAKRFGSSGYKHRRSSGPSKSDRDYNSSIDKNGSNGEHGTPTPSQSESKRQSPPQVSTIMNAAGAAAGVVPIVIGTPKESGHAIAPVLQGGVPPVSPVTEAAEAAAGVVGALVAPENISRRDDKSPGGANGVNVVDAPGQHHGSNSPGGGEVPRLVGGGSPKMIEVPLSDLRPLEALEKDLARIIKQESEHKNGNGVAESEHHKNGNDGAESGHHKNGNDVEEGHGPALSASPTADPSTIQPTHIPIGTKPDSPDGNGDSHGGSVDGHGSGSGRGPNAAGGNKPTSTSLTVSPSPSSATKWDQQAPASGGERRILP